MINPEKAVSVSEQCRLLEVPRSSYYRVPTGESPRNLAIMNRIDELYTADPTWGSRKLRDRLRLEGYAVNRKRIQRLMRLMGLEVIYPKRVTTRPAPGAKVYPYLLRDLPITRANQVWCTDITYIRLAHGFVYLVAVLDWYSRKVLSWRLSISPDQYFAIDALEEALRRYDAPEIFNTDQGCQFTCPNFLRPLQEAGVRVSMDGKGRALDNVVVERFWRSLKYEEVYLKDYPDLPEARRHIGAYIARYNGFRPHQSLGGRTPDALYAESSCEHVA
jgi:putative transposase